MRQAPPKDPGPQSPERARSRSRTSVLRAWRPTPFGVFAAICGIVVSAFILVPLVDLVVTTFWVDGRINTGVFADAWALPGLWTTLGNTAIVVLLGTLFATIIGSIFAWLNERSDARIGWLTDMLPIVPLMVPPIAGTIGWFLLAQEQAGFLNVLYRSTVTMLGGVPSPFGPLNIASWPGLVFVYTVYLVPHVYLVISASLRNLNPDLEEAARVSGASPWVTLRTVTLPAVLPGLGSGVFLAAIYALGLFSVPVIIGTQARIDILSVRIVSLLTDQFPPRLGEAVVLGLVLVAVIGGAWLLQTRILRAGRHATIEGRQGGQSRVALGRWRPVARLAMLGYVLICTVLPLIALVIVSLQNYWTPVIDFAAMSFKSYATIFGDSFTVGPALRNSILLGAGGATIAMLLAAILAFTIFRNAKNGFGRAVDGFTKLPGALSHIVMAMAVLAFFGGEPYRLHGTLLLLLIAYIIIYIPQATVNATSAYSQVGGSLSEASLVSGAGTGQTFFRIQLPLMASGLMAGWTFVFVLMVGDITASAILAGVNSPVVGFVILDLFGSGSYSTLAALSVLITLVSSAVVLTALTWTRRVSMRRSGARRDKTFGVRR